MELNHLKEERITLKREATEAKATEATWATKHEALERNLKQVSVVRVGRPGRDPQSKTGTWQSMHAAVV